MRHIKIRSNSPKKAGSKGTIVRNSTSLERVRSKNSAKTFDRLILRGLNGSFSTIITGANPGTGTILITMPLSLVTSWAVTSSKLLLKWENQQSLLSNCLPCSLSRVPMLCQSAITNFTSQLVRSLIFIQQM